MTYVTQIRKIDTFQLLGCESFLSGQTKHNGLSEKVYIISGEALDLSGHFTGFDLTRGPFFMTRLRWDNQQIRVWHGGFQSHGGTLIAGWFIVGNPIYKWMMTGGNPSFRKPPYIHTTRVHPMGVVHTLLSWFGWVAFLFWRGVLRPNISDMAILGKTCGLGVSIFPPLPGEGCQILCLLPGSVLPSFHPSVLPPFRPSSPDLICQLLIAVVLVGPQPARV